MTAQIPAPRPYYWVHLDLFSNKVLASGEGVYIEDEINQGLLRECRGDLGPILVNNGDVNYAQTISAESLKSAATALSYARQTRRKELKRQYSQIRQGIAWAEKSFTQPLHPTRIYAWEPSRSIQIKLPDSKFSDSDYRMDGGVVNLYADGTVSLFRFESYRRPIPKPLLIRALALIHGGPHYAHPRFQNLAIESLAKHAALVK